MSYELLRFLCDKNAYDNYLCYNKISVKTKSQLLVTAVSYASRNYEINHALRRMLRDFHDINLGILLYTASCVSGTVSTERVVRMLLEVDAEPKQNSLHAAIAGMIRFSTFGTIKMLCESGAIVENYTVQCVDERGLKLVENAFVVTFLIEMVV